MSSSSLSDKSASRIHSDRIGTSSAQPSSNSTSSDEESLSKIPLRSGFAEAYAILDEDSPDEAVSLDRVGRVDNACHGREGYSDEFFYMYVVLFTNLHVRLPFDEFTVGVLRILNVASSQLHPNAWAALQAFRFLCRILGLKPSPAVFLHHYSTRPKEPVRVVVNPLGRSYLFDGDTPKFPFYWTRNPLHYDEWPRTMMSAEDCEVFNFLDSLPWRLPTKRIVAILSSPRPRGDMLALMASHEGVGAGQKSHFHLLREKLNKRKKGGDNAPRTSSTTQPKGATGVGSPRPPLTVEKKKRKTAQKDGGSSRPPSQSAAACPGMPLTNV
ncbi:hypothetical protein DEO72_LG2g3233 [Vigna unguiculata]|uniref:Transposase (putative) gypsy type domain-containing protein n=1 Tax=Vigna unguiculata TaxID=3917 RepID=A0A4D6L302_VIGUN|nr:hypothetical protein DEO72_LG2g3233 [Vigna unguiculata]